MQKRKETRSSTNDLEGETTKFISNENTIRDVQCSPLDSLEERIRLLKHVENCKNLMKIKYASQGKKYRMITQSIASNL